MFIKQIKYNNSKNRNKIIKDCKHKHKESNLKKY